MANISFNNKKFPIKAVPTVGIAILVACAIVFLSEFFLRDSVRQLNLSDFELNEIDYEFQKILESENYEIHARSSIITIIKKQPKARIL